MLKKFISIATAVLVMATGISFVGATSASALTPVTSFELYCGTVPTAGSNAASVSCRNNSLTDQWTLGSPSWSPTISGTFVDNVVHSVTYTATADTGKEFTNVAANAVTLWAGHANTPYIQSVTSSAVVGSATTMTVVVNFKPVGGTSTAITALPITAPVAGAQPLTSLSLTGFQSNMTVNWSPTISFGGTFQSGVSYTARVMLNAETGFKIRNATSSTFTVDGASSVVYDTNAQYRLVAVFPAAGSSSSSSNSSSSSSSAQNSVAAGFAQSLATQFLQLARVQTARTTLLTGLSANKSGTLAQYAAAELDIKSEAALARVNAKVLALPAAQRSNVNEIAKIVKLENFVDSVSTSEIHSGTIAAQLVSIGFISSDNRLKLSLANALRSRPTSSIDSVEEIKVAIVEETARLQERVKRTAEIKAKIAARNK